MVAIMGAQEDIVEFLLLNGVDITLVDKVNHCMLNIRTYSYHLLLGRQESN
jgi:hypothetical protein